MHGQGNYMGRNFCAVVKGPEGVCLFVCVCGLVRVWWCLYVCGVRVCFYMSVYLSVCVSVRVYLCV